MRDATSRYRRVLVPLDGSSLAEGIIPFILEIAGPQDMKIVLLRVVPPVFPDKPLTSPRVVMDEMAEKVTEAREYVAALAADLWGRGMWMQVRVRCGAPVTEILTAAREVGADFIAMSTHGRSGFSRLPFGSVAEAVLRQADVPLLLMRATASEAREKQAELAA